MDNRKVFVRYLADRQMKNVFWKRNEIEAIEAPRMECVAIPKSYCGLPIYMPKVHILTDYERGYIAGMNHAVKAINRSIGEDIHNSSQILTQPYQIE